MSSAKLHPFGKNLDVVEPLLAPFVFEAVHNLPGHPVAGGVMKGLLYSWLFMVGAPRALQTASTLFFIKIRYATVQVNSLLAKLSSKNINMYLQFISFLHTNMTQVVEILSHVRQRLTNAT